MSIMNDLTAAIHAVSRGLLDNVPGVKEVIIVLSDDSSAESIESINAQIEYRGGAIPTLSLSVTEGTESKSLLSLFCDGYAFHYYRQSDLVKEIKGE